MKKHIVSAIIAAALAVAAFTANAQIISSPTGITNGSLSAPIQLNFAPITVSESINVPQHAALISNIVTNQWITLSYGRQPQGATGTNLLQFSSITTNFSAAWTLATYGYTTNYFSTVLIFPQQYAQPIDQLWGTFSNNIGTNTVIFN